MNIKKELFGTLPDGRTADLFTLENDRGMIVRITNFGGIITHVLVPDKLGKHRDVVLGFDNLESYLGVHPYFGCIVGRVANRIHAGRFILNDTLYTLAKNQDRNHLHGGISGFDKKLWLGIPESKEDRVSVILAYESPHMEEGYPGKLMVEVRYSLTNGNEIIIDYKAESDMDTVLNLTNHSYFNLRGDNSTILGHRLRLNAGCYTPADNESIPTGEILSVENTALDFRKGKFLSADWDRMENGYDHNFVLNTQPGKLNWFAELSEEESGIKMEAGTTEPGVQLYTSNYIEKIHGKNGLVYRKNAGLCLETQHFPDSPNKYYFPSVILRPGECYTQQTVYRFSLL